MILLVLRLWIAALVQRGFCLWKFASVEGAGLFAVGVGARARFWSNRVVGCELGIAEMLVRELDACGRCCLLLLLVSWKGDGGQAQQEEGIVASAVAVAGCGG